ncbi:MAG: hypothetical protein IVW55_12440 [Chloroflexi bacterium]|nr:hypothetical protein [Chloroflexota bacterium]
MYIEEYGSVPQTGPGSEQEEVYKTMLFLEELESLYEELEEQGATAKSGVPVSEELVKRMSILGLADAGAVRTEINRLHSLLDEMA